MPGADLLRSKSLPECGIGIPETFCVSLGVRDLRISLDHEYDTHAICRRDSTYRSDAKIGRRILFERIAELLKLLDLLSLVSGHEYCALGRLPKDAAIDIGESHAANAHIVDKATDAEITFVPGVFCCAQSNRVTHTVYDLMPKRKSAP